MPWSTRPYRWAAQEEEEAHTPCPECGWPPQNPGEIEIKVYWEDGGDPPPEDAPTENQYCESCGHPTYLIVTWQDLPDVEEEFDPMRSEKLRRQRDVIDLEERRKASSESREDGS